MKVRKRNGKIVEYDGKKIISAINKAFKAAEVEDIHNNFCSEMRKAEVADDAERMTLAREALKKDIKKLSGVLDRDQMRMYLRLLNITFVNRGVNFSE